MTRLHGSSCDNAEVIRCEHLDVLTKAVSERIANGWRLSGGICRIPMGSPGFDYQWMATLVRDRPVRITTEGIDMALDVLKEAIEEEQHD